MKRLFSTILALFIAGCAARTTPPPRQVVRATPIVPTLPAPAPATDWRDVPETAGSWTYRTQPDGSVAAFGRVGAEPDVLLRCDKAARTVALSRAGAATGALTLKTSYGEKSWPTGQLNGRTMVVLAGTDPTLDQIAFSRGRFSIALPGLPTVIMPAWAEPARVIEDCRT